MIAQLTPIRETRVGKDLIQEGLEEGQEKKEKEIVLRMNAGGMPVEQIESITGIPKEKILQHLAAE